MVGAPRDTGKEPPLGDPKEDSLVGTEVGPFMLLSRVGRGERGDVYLARRTDNRADVALKVVRIDRDADINAVERYRKRVMAGQRDIHPHIVHVLESGRQGQLLYFAHEILEGESLDRLLSGAPATVDDAIRLARLLCELLAHGHGKDWVHGRVWPSNVLLDEAGGLRLINGAFPKSGLEKELSTVTFSQRLLDDWSFMAPESFDTEPTPATDVYGVGATLYFALTGRPPYIGATISEVIRAIGGPFPGIGQLRAGVPEPLAELAQRCLAADPAARPASTTELLSSMLLAHPGGESVLVRSLKCETSKPSSPAAGKGAPYLLIYEPEQGGFTVPLDRRVLLIGRSKRCDIRLKQSSISREHAVVEQTPTGFQIECVSRGGKMFVNRRQVHKHFLRHEDVIQIASCTMEYRLDSFPHQPRQKGSFVRQFARLPAGMDVRYRFVLTPPAEIFVRGDTLPVGQGGVLVGINDRHRDRVTTGAESVELELTYPDGKRRRFLGEVLNVEAIGGVTCMGIKLHQVSERKYAIAMENAKRSGWYDAIEPASPEPGEDH